MKIEEEVRDVYGAIKPLPGGEDRMWIAIDRALDGKAKDVQIQLRPRRVKLRPFLTAAAVIVLLLMSLALLRSLRPRPENGGLSVSLATAAPETESTPRQIREIRAIELVNAQVDGSELLTVSEEGQYLARAVLRSGFCVDHWELNGEKVDSPSRRFSLFFDSTGVKKVEAVLREERRIICENAYLQFPDESGQPAGRMYRDLCFEYDYTVPTTGLPHPGGTITAFVLPVIPEGMELEAWLIDGQRVEAGEAAARILLDGLDRSVTIEALLREETGAAGAGESLTLGEGGGSGAFLEQPEDDRPAGWSSLPENTWLEIDYQQDGVPFDPSAPTWTVTRTNGRWIRPAPGKAPAPRRDRPPESAAYAADPTGLDCRPWSTASNGPSFRIRSMCMTSVPCVDTGSSWISRSMIWVWSRARRRSRRHRAKREHHKIKTGKRARSRAETGFSFQKVCDIIVLSERRKGDLQRETGNNKSDPERVGDAGAGGEPCGGDQAALYSGAKAVHGACGSRRDPGAGVHTGGCPGANDGAVAGTDPGAHGGADSRADSRAHPGTHTGAHARTHAGAGGRAAADPGHQPQ